MTMATQAVLRTLLEDPTRPRYGFDIAGEAGIATGSLYPILARLEHLTWLDSYWEDVADVHDGRPRRRYYRLSDTGAVAARDALDRASRRVPKSWRPAAGLA
ncbi:PadR family transcriptional regulator [Amorphoplanes digitatis]|nr:PadR family transcriptional regulator [Actinoplanes digitatis]GID98308.1 PadR family transcriptional regulator [Actinoplanes digitatis]